MGTKLGGLALAATALATVGGAALLAHWSGALPLDAKADWAARLQEQLTLGAALALLIERSVEIWLNATAQNGPDRHDATVTGDTSAAVPAAIASLTLGVLLALVGVRFLGAVIETSPTTQTLSEGAADTSKAFLNALRQGIDIVITGGLLAGGSKVMHEVVEGVLMGGLKRVSTGLSSTKT